MRHLAIWLLLGGGVSAVDVVPDVLVVNSYHRGYRWSDDILCGIDAALAASGTPIKVHSEYLDSKRHPQVMDDPALPAFLRAKYAGTRFSAIITTDDNATWFMVRERGTLFPGTPLVFCGVNDLQPERLHGQKGVTGVNEVADIGDTIACMLRLHPRTTRLLVVTDTTETGQGVIRVVERWRAQCPPGLQLDLIADISQAELAEAVGHADEGTLILYSFFFRDRTGRTFDAEDSARLVMARARVPVYTTWDFNQGFGMVGGKLTCGGLQGRTAGRLALHLLSGAQAADLPVQMESPNSWVFEHAALERFGIPHGALPSGSVVIGAPDSTYGRYQGAIWAMAAALTCLLTIIAVLIRTIRRRQRAEQALRHSEQHHREFIELMVDGILTGASDGTITGANARMLEICGRTRDQLIGTHVSRLFEPDLLNRKPLRFDLLDQGQTVISERTIRRPEGALVTVEMHSRRMPDGSYHSIYRDITERRHAEDALRESNLRRDAFFQGVRDAILIADSRDGRLVEVNRAAEELLGRSRDDLVGSHHTCIHPAEMAKDGADLFRRHTAGDSGIFESVVQHHDGHHIPVEVSSRTIVLPDGRRLVLGIFRDIRERKAIVEQLRQAEKLTAIGQLAGGVAHDFNNQLTGILGYGELLAQRIRDDEGRGCIEGIRRAVASAADLTQQLLAFARKGRHLNQPTDVNHLIRQVVDLLRHSIDKRIEIQTDLAVQALPVVGDPNQLQNALLNLGLNARDAMPQGGTLSFTTRAIMLPGVSGDAVEIVVADSGCGMDADTQAHIFEPFFTTKELGKGTGLGLAAVYGTVQEHGGSIAVHSEPGTGSIFTIILPRSSQVSEVAPDQDKLIPMPAALGRRILVIDDEESVRTTTADILTVLGYQVTSAADGETAIALFAAEGADIDLVILDLVLPRMEGHAIYNALCRIRPGIRVLIASGYSLGQSAQRILDAGARGFLQKPYQFQELARRVAEVLG